MDGYGYPGYEIEIYLSMMFSVVEYNWVVMNVSRRMACGMRVQILM